MAQLSQRHHDHGCPTFRGFRKVGTTDLDTIFIRRIPSPEFRAEEPRLTCAKSPDTIVRGTHPSKIAKGGAASVVVAPTIKTKGGQPLVSGHHSNASATHRFL